MDVTREGKIRAGKTWTFLKAGTREKPTPLAIGKDGTIHTALALHPAGELDKDSGEHKPASKQAAGEALKRSATALGLKKVGTITALNTYWEGGVIRVLKQKESFSIGDKKVGLNAFMKACGLSHSCTMAWSDDEDEEPQFEDEAQQQQNEVEEKIGRAPGATDISGAAARPTPPLELPQGGLDRLSKFEANLVSKFGIDPEVATDLAKFIKGSVDDQSLVRGLIFDSKLGEELIKTLLPEGADLSKEFEDQMKANAEYLLGPALTHMELELIDPKIKAMMADRASARALIAQKTIEKPDITQEYVVEKIFQAACSRIDDPKFDIRDAETTKIKNIVSRNWSTREGGEAESETVSRIIIAISPNFSSQKALSNFLCLENQTIDLMLAEHMQASIKAIIDKWREFYRSSENGLETAIKEADDAYRKKHARSIAEGGGSFSQSWVDLQNVDSIVVSGIDGIRGKSGVGRKKSIEKLNADMGKAKERLRSDQMEILDGEFAPGKIIGPLLQGIDAVAKAVGELSQPLPEAAPAA